MEVQVLQPVGLGLGALGSAFGPRGSSKPPIWESCVNLPAFEYRANLAIVDFVQQTCS